MASVALISTGFLRQAAAIAGALGIPHVPLAEYPGTIPTDSPEVIRAKCDSHVAPAAIEGLVRPGDVAAATPPRNGHGPSMSEIVASGSLDEVQDMFEDRLWTDGLPVVPPTVDRVERFLAHTPRAPDEVLGILAPDYRSATVWSVAVNGVMAGCRAEYMPILVAAVECMADHEFRIQHAGSTPGWEPLAVLSGSMVERFNFATGAGLMRMGPRANTSVGRFMRLYMRNVAGLRVPPGTTDKGSIGSSFNVALCEDDEAVRGVGWEPFRVDRGFDPYDEVVTAQSVYAVGPPIYSGTGDPHEHVEVLAHMLGLACGPWVFTALMWRKWSPLLLLGPSVAGVLARNGWTKDDIRQYMYEHATVEARWLERYPSYAGVAWADLRRLIEDGAAPPEFAQSSDSNRRVPALLAPENLNIVVSGDPGRNQSRFYVNNHEQGFPVSKAAEFVTS